MHWIVLGASCAAMLIGMEVDEVTLAALGLTGLIVGFSIGRQDVS
jgi:hypothetical protein